MASWSDRRLGCLRESGSDDERDEDNKEEEDDQDEPSLQNGHFGRIDINQCLRSSFDLTPRAEAPHRKIALPSEFT